MIGVRLAAFNDSAGEPEQDANSALTELDKGTELSNWHNLKNRHLNII